VIAIHNSKQNANWSSLICWPAVPAVPASDLRSDFALHFGFGFAQVSAELVEVWVVFVVVLVAAVEAATAAATATATAVVAVTEPGLEPGPDFGSEEFADVELKPARPDHADSGLGQVQ